jgi:uncharacterized repeat protein (TIGR03803 family)
MTKLLRFPLCFASVCVLVLALLAPRPLEAGSYKVLHAFSESRGGSRDGYFPQSDVILDRHGNIYGTTVYGGTGCNGYGCGVVFRLGPKGEYTVLHRFTGTPDGWAPGPGRMVVDDAGNLYGATGAGGSGPCFDGDGCGVIFKVDPSGRETILYNFAGGSAGQGPNSGLVRDSAGSLYGTTELGGDSNCGYSYGCGVVFKVDTTGNETVLYTFGGLPDAEFPQAGLAMDSAGTLYGAAGGGAFGFGSVFKVDSSGQETVLYSFTGGEDGDTPIGAPVVDSSGNVYGATWRPNFEPRIYKVDSQGNETTLHAFHGIWHAEASLVLDSKGNLYSTTAGGGRHGDGSVFELGPGGKFTILYSFQPGDGSGPGSAVTLDGPANLYGTAGSPGVVYRLTP